MLYLLLDFIINDFGNPEKILKIGYSEKSFCKSR